MEILNRSIEPGLQSIERIKIIEAEKKLLKNGIEVFTINAGTQDVLKVDLFFDAGDIYDRLKVTGQAASHLIDDGTLRKSALQIAEEIESYGISIECHCEVHQSIITVHTLVKYLERAMNMVCEIISEAVYPANEVEIYAIRNKQQLLVNNEKMNFIAQKEFRKAMFGAGHYYGRSQEAEDFDTLSSQSLLTFYNKYYKGCPFKVIASGKIADQTLNILDQTLGNLIIANFKAAEAMIEVEILPANKVHIKKENAIQNAIRIGQPIIGRTHVDFPVISLVNTLLGGYFGSRLMSNVREDKGYTYGIGSGITHLKHASFLAIATEVGHEVCEPALKEIYFEIRRLQTETIADTELNLLKNYMQGAFLRNIDGPFALSEIYKTILTFNLNYAYFYNYLDKLKTASAKDLQQAANEYLKPGEMTEVIAGNL